jgi:hypothetical protein
MLTDSESENPIQKVGYRQSSKPSVKQKRMNKHISERGIFDPESCINSSNGSSLKEIRHSDIHNSSSDMTEK